MCKESKFDILGLITARGGSKGVPRKNTRMVAGKPLIGWTIEAAKAAKSVSRVVLSTDDKKIAELGERYGAAVPFIRPPELAEDASSHVNVVLHALKWFEENEQWKPDFVLLLQPTSPLRTAIDIDEAVDLAIHVNADAVVSVCESPAHPYFIRLIDEQGTLQPFCDIPPGYLRRQELPRAFFVNGAIYLIRPEILRIQRTWFPEPTYAYQMPIERSLNIDSEWDLQQADILLGSDEGEIHGIL